MYYLGIDFGGGSSKATLIDERGKVVATSSSEYPTTYAENGLATQKPLDWFNAAVTNIKSILNKGIKAEEIECVCFSAATHTAVLLDENEKVICDSIYWTDTRSKKEKEFLLKEYKDYLFDKCLHLPDTIWTLPELMFLHNNDPELYKKIKHVLFAKDYVRHLFCSSLVTDYIEAEGSMLFDFKNNVWDEKLLALAHLDKSQMPKIVSPLDEVGTVSEWASKESGLSTKTKVICGCTDTAMEVLASGGVKKGDMTLKLATAGRICLVTDKPYPDKNIINYSHLNKGLYYPGSATKSCAASLRWFRDTWGGDYKELDELAAQVPLGSDGLIFHPYLMGELTPHANPNLRGSYFGISSLHSKKHFVRALLEGVAFSLLDCYLYFKKQGINLPEKAFILGGGSKSSLWRQIVSDVLGIELYVTENNDSSFGGSLCAATACGKFASLTDAIKQTQKIIGEVKPNAENHKKYMEIFEKYQKITGFLVEFYKNE